MKTITIESLELSNWRAQSRKISFGRKTTISGRNRSGKSTVVDAVLWLLTGFDAEDRNNFQIFDTCREYTPQDNPPAWVEGIFNVDGTQYTLKKSAQTGWTRPRGSDTYVKKNTDEYRFFRDGVELSAGDYNAFVKSVFGDSEHLKFMMNIMRYRLMDWKSLRNVLSEIIGEINDEDYKGDFSNIRLLISKYGSLDAAKDVIKGRITPLRDSVGVAGKKKGKIEIEIDTLTDTKPDVANADKAAARADEIRKEIAGIDMQIAEAMQSLEPSGKEREEAQRRISETRNRIAESESAYESEFRKNVAGLTASLSAAEAENMTAKSKAAARDAEVKSKESMAESTMSDIERMRKFREELLEKNRKVKSMQFTEDRCPYCGQELPEDMLERQRKEFEDRKAAEHERIVAQGKRNNVMIEEAQKRVADLMHDIEVLKAQEYPLKETEQMRSDLEALRKSHVPFRSTSEYAELDAEIKKIESELHKAEDSDMESAAKEKIEDMKVAKAALLDELSLCSEVAGEVKTAKAIEEKIQKKREELKNSAAELARLEGLLASAEEMERQRAEIIRMRVARLFDWCTVEMEQKKKDGSMQPACNIMLDHVPSQVTNYASKVLIGIDLSDAFCRHYGVSLPLFIDNAESIDPDADVNPLRRQLVMLSRDDCEFMVEAE